MGKKAKIITAIVSVFLVLAVIVGITATAVNKDSLSASLLYSLMPKELEGEFENDKGETYKIMFYLRKNPNYDSKNDSDIMNAFEVYYYDDNGEEVNLGSTGTYEASNQTINPLILFMYKAGEQLGEIKKNVKLGVGIFVAVLIVALIIIWFIVFSKQEDAKKAKLNENKHQGKRKKK